MPPGGLRAGKLWSAATTMVFPMPFLMKLDVFFRVCLKCIFAADGAEVILSTFMIRFCGGFLFVDIHSAYEVFAHRLDSFSCVGLEAAVIIQASQRGAAECPDLTGGSCDCCEGRSQPCDATSLLLAGTSSPSLCRYTRHTDRASKYRPTMPLRAQ